ncbi:hypothetical protein OROGR_025954 [Orobanche gracilis]
MTEAGEIQQSHLAFLQNIQIGSSFSRAPVPFGFGNSDLNSQHEGYAALEAMMLANSTPLRVPFRFGNSDLNSQHEGYAALEAMMLANSTPFKNSMGTQGIRNSADYNVLGEPVSLANDASNYAQADPAALRLKDDIPLNSRGWGAFVRAESRDPGFSSKNLANFGHGYTLYDERYIGLPVDPHLRIFNATNENDGNQVTESKGPQT